MARLFAAIWLPSEVESHLDEYVDGPRTAHPHLRWVAPSRWHITLEFLGECGPHEQSRQLGRWERRASRGMPLDLQLTGAGTFPKKAWMARVLWVGVAGDVPGWRKLAGYGQEPHLTIARTRERTDLTGLSEELGRYSGPAWTASEVALVESHHRGPNDRGPRYEPLMTWPLGRG